MPNVANRCDRATGDASVECPTAIVCFTAVPHTWVVFKSNLEEMNTNPKRPNRLHHYRPILSSLKLLIAGRVGIEGVTTGDRCGWVANLNNSFGTSPNLFYTNSNTKLKMSKPT